MGSKVPPGTVGAARGSLCLPLSQQLREHRALKWHSLLSELREILNKSSKQLSRVIKSHLKELENPGVQRSSFLSCYRRGKGKFSSSSSGLYFTWVKNFKNQISTIPLSEHQKFLLLGGAVRFWHLDQSELHSRGCAEPSGERFAVFRE